MSPTPPFNLPNYTESWLNINKQILKIPKMSNWVLKITIYVKEFLAHQLWIWQNEWSNVAFLIHSLWKLYLAEKLRQKFQFFFVDFCIWKISHIKMRNLTFHFSPWKVAHQTLAIFHAQFNILNIFGKKTELSYPTFPIRLMLS